MINRGMLFFILPSILLGVLSWFFPYIYAFLPVPNSEICLCTYFWTDSYDIFFKKDYYVLVSINVTCYYGVNLMFMLLLIIMVWRIRRI
jgi:hypothetical protein